MSTAWPFPDPEKREVITLGRILRGDSAILLVTHDLEDGGWQFLDGEHIFESDGLAVQLGEIAQFDPSLNALADLPPGWCATRSHPDEPWTRIAEDSEPDSPVATGETAATTSSDVPARNIEIKARVADLNALRQKVIAIGEAFSEVLFQEDVFYEAPEGRLKLRIFDDGESEGELILYRRSDEAGPKASHYQIAPTSRPIVLKSILGQVLPEIGIVRKRRELYLIGQTRVHLDEVDGLGDFMELEVVLRADQSEEEGAAIADALVQQLGITPDSLIRTAYLDLLKDGAARPPNTFRTGEE